MTHVAILCSLRREPRIGEGSHGNPAPHAASCGLYVVRRVLMKTGVATGVGAAWRGGAVTAAAVPSAAGLASWRTGLGRRIQL